MTRRRFSWALALVLAWTACSGNWFERTPDLPDLPELAMDNFSPAVRKQVETRLAGIRQNPESASANGRLGMVLHAHNQFGSAAVCYRRASLLDSESFRWAYYLGLVQAAEGNHDEAAATFDQALELNPDYLAARLQMAESLLAAGKTDESGEIFERIVKEHPTSSAAHFGWGRVLSRRRDFPLAAESYRKAIQLFPAYGASHYQLALAYRNLEDNEKAERHMALYEEHKMGAPPSGDQYVSAVRRLDAGAGPYVRRGIDLERQGNLALAAAEHEKALEIDPNLVQVHVNLMIIYGKMGRFEKAEQRYRDIQRLNPNDEESHYNYGVLLAEEGRSQEARKAFERAIEVNPNNPEAHHNLGYILEQQGREEEAFQHYRKTLENRPDHRLANYHLGRILVSRKLYEQGIPHLLKTLAPEDEKTPQFLYAVATAYSRSGNRPATLRYARQAKEKAASHGQTQLVAVIEKDMRTLEQAGGTE